MSERVSNGYKRLFEVRLLHHFWLDDGAVPFDRIADAAKKTRWLLTYDRRPFLAVRPTESTQRALSGPGLVFKNTALGFVVAAPSAITLAADTVFEFTVTPAAQQFMAYTALTLRPQAIVELADPGGGEALRYKANVPVLSNLTGDTRTLVGAPVLFLSRPVPAPDAADLVESLVVSGGALHQLTADNPGAASQELGADAGEHPVYVHQADAPIIIPPPGVTGAPERGVRLSADVTDDVFALFSLRAVRPGNDAFSFVDAAGAPKASPPVYEVRFKNRSTVWTYLDRATGALKSAEAQALPLTSYGNAGTKTKPSAEMIKAELTAGRITKLVSEIYV